MPEDFSVVINGQRLSTRADAERPLLDVLREDFKLTGTKYGCGEGQCGACTVLVDGVPMRSCITTIGEIVMQFKRSKDWKRIPNFIKFNRRFWIAKQCNAVIACPATS